MDKDGSKEGSPTSVLVLGIIVFLLLVTLTVLEGVYNCFKPLPPPPAGTAIASEPSAQTENAAGNDPLCFSSSLPSPYELLNLPVHLPFVFFCLVFLFVMWSLSMSLFPSRSWFLVFGLCLWS